MHTLLPRPAVPAVLPAAMTRLSSLVVRFAPPGLPEGEDGVMVLHDVSIWGITEGSFTPVPMQAVHQPIFELNENIRGSGSGKLVPHDEQARFVENSFVSSASEASP